MAPARRSLVSSRPGPTYHRQLSTDLNRTQSLNSETTFNSLKGDSRPAVDDSDLDQFWVTTDEESDGEVPWRQGHIARRRLKDVEGSMSRASKTDVHVPHNHEQPSHLANGFASQRGQGLHASTDITPQINQPLNELDAVNGRKGTLTSADTAFQDEVPSSGAGTKQAFGLEEYEMNVAKLREVEKQAGVDRPLEAKVAGMVVMQVQAKVARLGLEDVHQRKQVAICILEAEVARAHASATLSEWDGVGQGLRKLVTEKDTELQALRALAAEQKKLAESSGAFARDIEVFRQEAQSKAAEVEKITAERDQLRVALSDAEMDLQTATSSLGKMKQETKQGLTDGREEERGSEKRLGRRQSSVRLQEKLVAAEEVNRVNQGVVRGLEEQLRAVKEGWVKERAQWVKDAIAQQSAIMEHIRDRETYARNKEREIKKLGLGLETARKSAEEELQRKEEDIRSLAAKLEAREKERGQLDGSLGEQTTAQAAMIAGLEEQVREQTRLVKLFQERTKAQSVTITGLENRVKEQNGFRGEVDSVRVQLEASNKLVESLMAQVVLLEKELKAMKAREAKLRVSNGAHETRAAQVAVGLAELTSRMNGLESEKQGLRSALETSENKRRELSEDRETILARMKEREATVVAAEAEIRKLTEDADNKVRIAVVEKDAELRGEIAGLESKICELEGAVARSSAENDKLLGVLEGRGDQQGSQERRRSFERRDSLGVEGQELLGVLKGRQGGQGGLERRVSADEVRTSKEAEALSKELRATKEEREKLQLKTEFLRKKVGELKEQTVLQTEQAAATAQSHNAELNRLRAEADAANRRAELLGKTCRGLQAQLNHVAAGVAPNGGSPTKRKRTRTDVSEELEGTETGAEGSGGVKAALDAQVAALEKKISEKDWALAGKSRELQAKEAEVRGLQEILRVLARELEEVEGTPRKDGRGSNESGVISSVELTPAKSHANSVSRSVNGSVLSAVKNALRGSLDLVSTPRNSLEVARAVVPRMEPLNGSVLVSKERVALKREIRELYERLEYKEEELEEQTREFRAAEQSALATWQAQQQEVVKELEGKALKLGVMEEAFQELITKLEETRAEAEAAATNARAAEERAGESEHAQTMMKQRLEKLEALDKKGDSLWKEMARLAAANASLEDQLAQLTSSAALSTQPEPVPITSPKTSSDGFERQRSSLKGLIQDGSTSTAEADAAFTPMLPTSAGDLAKATVEQLGGASKPVSKAASVRVAAETSGGATEEHVSPRRLPSPVTQSEGPLIGSVSASPAESPTNATSPLPATSPSLEAQKAQELSNSVFDRLAILRQRYAADGAPDSPGASTPTAASFYSPVNRSPRVSPAERSGKDASGTIAVPFLSLADNALPVSPTGSSGIDTPSATSPSAASLASPGNKRPPVSPAGSSGRNSPATISLASGLVYFPNMAQPPVSPSTPPGKRARSQDGSPKDTKNGGGVRNLVRWLETKVPSKKASAPSSPSATSPGYILPTGNPFAEKQRSPGGDHPSGKNRASVPSPTGRKVSEPGDLGGRAKGAVGSVNWKTFARELPRLELPGDVSENAGEKKSISPDVRARLEILRQRSIHSQAGDSSPTEPLGQGAPSPGNRPIPVPLTRSRTNSSDGASSGMSERMDSMRREERVSAGFGSPQANAVPAILSWIPPLEALGSGAKTPRMAERAKHGVEVGRSVERPGESAKGVPGRWDDARGAVAGASDSPSSVLERLAMLQARGNAYPNPAAT